MWRWVATLTTMLRKIGEKQGTECLNTRFPLSTLLYAEYSVKLIKKVYKKNYILQNLITVYNYFMHYYTQLTNVKQS